jgi:acyl carrier protein
MISTQEFRVVIIDALVGIKSIDSDRRQALLADINADIELATLSIDSMSVIDLCMVIEEKTNREVLIEELIENPTINKLAKHLGEH